MAFSVPSFFKYKGALDEVKIWNYALSAQDVSNEYNGIIAKRLICQYSLEGSTQDLIGNYPASNYGATFIAGHSGQAAYFNGSSYIASSLPLIDAPS